MTASPASRDRTIDLAGRIALRVTLVVVAVLATVWLALQLTSVLLIAFVALILAAGALGPVGMLERAGAPPVVAVLGVYAAVVAGLVVVGILVAPPVVDQLSELIAALPSLAEELGAVVQDTLASLGSGGMAQRLLDLAAGQLEGFGGAISGIPLALTSAIVAITTAVFLSILLLLERRTARSWVFQFVDVADRPTLEELADKAMTRLGAFVRGQLLIMTVTGVATAIGLTLIGVPFPVALGLLAFLTEAIPIAGPIIAGAVMVAVALLESPGQAAATIVLVFAIQQLEGLVLVPQIQGRVISISPAVALLAVFAGGALGGVAGALVAIPAVAIATVVIDDIVIPWRHREIDTGGEGSDETPEGAGERVAAPDES